MRHSCASRVRMAAALVLAVVALLTSACAGAVTPNPTGSQAPQPSRRLHDLLPKPVRDRGFLRVGTDASYAPMSSFGPGGLTIVGMEPDLGVRIGRLLGVRLEFGNVDFAKLRGQVASGALDLAMSAMTDTPARARSADFVDYFRAGTSIVVQHGNPAGITSLDDLCGKVVAVESGTTQVDLLARTQQNCVNRRIEVRTYPTNSDALVQLRTGRAVAVLDDYSPAVFLVNDARTRSQYQLASNLQYEPGLYGVAVAKSQPGLRAAVQGALEELLRDGGYTQVLDRWHVQEGAVRQITINSGR